MWPRPLKTTISSLDAVDATEEMDGEREGLRIVIWARAFGLPSNGESELKPGGEGVTGTATFSLMVPSKQPALTKEIGR
jgi:hypothetical protein